MRLSISDFKYQNLIIRSFLPQISGFCFEDLSWKDRRPRERQTSREHRVPPPHDDVSYLLLTIDI